MREGNAEVLRLKDEIEKKLEEAHFEEQKVRECTSERVEDLEYRLTVGVAEAQKWTDNTYQLIQYI